MHKIMTDSEKISELESKLASALAKIAELELLLSKVAQKKTSKNSHRWTWVEKNQSLREKSTKPVGGQLGHEGITLEGRETPDIVVDLRPDYCNSCGKHLEDSTFDLLGSRQVIDIPPIVPIATDYRCFGTRCSCGHEAKGVFPPGVDYAVQYGPLTILESQLNDPIKHKETLVFFEQMHKLKKGLFTFLEHEKIPFDNNASERAIRNVKVKIKVSGQFKSLQNEFAILRSVIDTATKNGQSVFEAIAAIVYLPTITNKAG